MNKETSKNFRMLAPDDEKKPIAQTTTPKVQNRLNGAKKTFSTKEHLNQKTSFGNTRKH